MSNLDGLKPERVFYYFEEISKIPRGSGNTTAISDYCEEFANKFNLEYIKDQYGNIIIFKDASKGYESIEPIILQGHLDMVCQKTDDCNIDFKNDPLDIYIDGDFVKAKNTTLGADNGIAVSMILALLESSAYMHPRIEAVFTVDEEVGMLGALKLDMTHFKAKRMINIDSEDEGVVTVSCAGGQDVTSVINFNTTKVVGNTVQITINGLKGGHSGIEIDKNRVNANILAGRLLNMLDDKVQFDIIDINGGDKANAIPKSCVINILVNDLEVFSIEFANITNLIKTELNHKEPDLAFNMSPSKSVKEETVIERNIKDKLIYSLCFIPNGVLEMSAEIEGLVETSLNLGILKTNEKEITICSSLRSNKISAMDYLTKRLYMFYENQEFKVFASGNYPPWEYNDNSYLQKVYSSIYESSTHKKCKVEAIHAGLECGVFASAIDKMDCISIGPDMHDVHTTDERLSISSTERTFNLLLDILKELN